MATILMLLLVNLARIPERRKGNGWSGPSRISIKDLSSSCNARHLPFSKTNSPIKTRSTKVGDGQAIQYKVSSVSSLRCRIIDLARRDLDRAASITLAYVHRFARRPSNSYEVSKRIPKRGQLAKPE